MREIIIEISGKPRSGKTAIARFIKYNLDQNNYKTIIIDKNKSTESAIKRIAKQNDVTILDY